MPVVNTTPGVCDSPLKAANMTPEERRKATVYTSGEHCPMCAAAHGWVGLGRMYASSSKQLAQWLTEMGVLLPPVKTLSIEEVIRDAVVDGPVPELAEEIRQLHKEYYERKRYSLIFHIKVLQIRHLFGARSWLSGFLAFRQIVSLHCRVE